MERIGGANERKRGIHPMRSDTARRSSVEKKSVSKPRQRIAGLSVYVKGSEPRNGDSHSPRAVCSRARTRCTPAPPCHSSSTEWWWSCDNWNTASPVAFGCSESRESRETQPRLGEIRIGSHGEGDQARGRGSWRGQQCGRCCRAGTDTKQSLYFALSPAF